MSQMLRLTLLLICVTLAGCFDYAASRRICIEQVATTSAPTLRFNLDTSQIPSSWIEQMVVEPQTAGDVVQMRFDSRHPIKIIIVPDVGSDASAAATTQPIR